MGGFSPSMLAGVNAFWATLMFSFVMAGTIGDYWFDADDPIPVHAGMWNCVNCRYADISARDTVRAFAILFIFAQTTSLAAACIALVQALKQRALKTSAVVGVVSSLVGVLCGIVSMSVWVDQINNSNYGWAFGLFTSAWVLILCIQTPLFFFTGKAAGHAAKPGEPHPGDSPAPQQSTEPHMSYMQGP